jgi:hypothetical protein
MRQKSVPKKIPWQHPYKVMVQQLADQGLQFDTGKTWEEEVARLQAEEQRCLMKSTHTSQEMRRNVKWRQILTNLGVLLDEFK